MLRIVENTVSFQTKFGKYTGKITHFGSDGFFFSDFSGNNARSLCDAGFKDSVSREDLFEKILGYRPEPGGQWPWCKTKEDVIKILRYLTREENKNFIRLASVV